MIICIMSCFEDLLEKDTGGSVRIYNLAKNLAKLGHEVDVVIPSQKEEEIRISNGLTVYKSRGLYPLFLFRFFSILLGAKKFTSFFFYDPFFITKVYRIIIRAQIVQLEQPWAGGILIPFVKNIAGKPLIVDCHDALQSLRLQHVNLFRKFLETFLEKLAYKLADLVFVVSSKESKLLIENGVIKEKLFIVPNGVDAEVFSKLSKKNYSQLEEQCGLKNVQKVIFVGNMEYFPNQEAVRAIASYLAPRVQEAVKEVKFLIIGRCPKQFQINSPHLIYTGVVENVAEYLNISDAAIAPLFSGSGTRLKILEFFACGLPVVSTSIGAEGLDTRDGKNILIEDDMNEFSAKVVRVLTDKEFAGKLGESARDFVVENYDWTKIAKRLDTVYRLLI